MTIEEIKVALGILWLVYMAMPTVDQNKEGKGNNMAHPKEIKDRPCPNRWKECACCKHERDCRAGLYKGEEDIIIAAEIADKAVIAEAIESAHKIKGTWQDEFLQQPSKDIWVWMAKWKRPSDLHHVDAIPLDGPSAPGGGSKSKAAKKPQKKIPEYMKFLGM